MSAKFELDNGKLKEYRTFCTDLGDGVSHPGRPYHTKCGLSFTEVSKDGACDHLECAIYAARDGAIYPIAEYCLLSFILIVSGYYGQGDLFAGFREEEGFLIIFGFLFISLSLLPFRHWLELREYKNHGTIHGRIARRL